MVKFLLNRPIAVTMSFMALLTLGVVALYQLPVSLMPDIDIPNITVNASYSNGTAQELEKSVAAPLRQGLMRLSHLKSINSESRDGESIIYLDFDYGTDLDYAFIEVNEKIDRVVNNLSVKIDRPKIIKASASDIPVFYLNLTLKDDSQDPMGLSKSELFPVSDKFMKLSDFSGQIIQSRIEQLQEVAMIDVSGMVFPELLIIPDRQKMEALQVSIFDIELAIKSNNVNLGNLLIRDGQYQYNIRFSSTIKDSKDIENIYLKKEDRLLQLKDIAKIVYHPKGRQGLVTSNGKDAITMAVIKQSNAQMDELKDKLISLIDQFELDYPEIEFEIIRNQTLLLEHSISNLQQSLILGAILAFLLMFIFLKSVKAPFLIGITIPTSLIISFLFFYITDISINIISLSGLILGVGMMIDNSIVVIDNITQHYERGKSLDQACSDGTNEVSRALLSSVLTTCAVFIPLIFISGISGAIFFDQAVAISIGLMVSLVVSITILPVYYKLLYSSSRYSSYSSSSKRKMFDYGALYESGFRLVMRNQRMCWLIIILLVMAIGPLYLELDKRKLPELTTDEVLVHLNWNEHIHLDENRGRTERVVDEVKSLLEHHTCLIGNQQFLLDHSSSLTASESVVYLKTSSQEKLDEIKDIVVNYINKDYPSAIIKFSAADNIFNILFPNKSASLTAKFKAIKEASSKKSEQLNRLVNNLADGLEDYPIDPIEWEENMVVEVSHEKLAIFNISFDDVYRELKSAFRDNKILSVSENQYSTPIVIGDKVQLIGDILRDITVYNNDGDKVNLRSLLKQSSGMSLKNIIAGREGEYYPIEIDVAEDDLSQSIDDIKSITKANGDFEVDFESSIFEDRVLMRELLIILLISLLLLYFILASQFESLVLPLIVLIEVPIDIFGSFLLLYIWGSSINLMSLIGIVVMSGIIINDSILKIDTINQLQKQGVSLLRSLAVAGQRRLKPILMTSLTTILALIPFLFISGMGADLQRPLALAIIGGMIVGTVVSLYLIPLLFYVIKYKRT